MRLRRDFGLFVSCLLIFEGIVQVFFYNLQNEGLEKAQQATQSLTRHELVSSNIYLIGRSLNDLHDLGLISCVSLTREMAKLPFMDLRFKDDCETNFLKLNGLNSTFNILSVNGSQIRVQLKSSNDRTFFITLWLVRFFVLIVLSISFLFVRKSLDIKQIETQNALRDLYNEKERISGIEKVIGQVYHDVASPLTALNMVLINDMVSAKAMPLVQRALERTSEIIDDLKRLRDDVSSKENVFNLRDELSSLLAEKNLLAGGGLEIEKAIPDGPIFISAIKSELRRALSNILNNACEATRGSLQPKIWIGIQKYSDRVELIIANSGSSFPLKVITRVGERGLSMGKVNGTGLGLSHAFNFMKNLGGQLVLSNRADGGWAQVNLIFPRPR